MNWQEFLTIHGAEFREWVAESWRDNRALFWRIVKAYSAFTFFFFFWAAFFHGVSLLTTRMNFTVSGYGVAFATVVDVICAILTNISLLGALICLAKLAIIGAGLVDAAEIVPNTIAGGIGRLWAVFNEGKAPEIPGKGLNNMKDMAKACLKVGSGLMALHLVWWGIIIQMRIADRPIPFMGRVAMIMAYAACIFWIGYKQIDMSVPLKQWIHVGMILWFVSIVLDIFGFYAWLGISVPASPDENQQVLAGAILAFLIGSALKNYGATKAAGIAAQIAAVFVIIFVHPWIYNKWVNENLKDTWQRKVFPSAMAEGMERGSQRLVKAVAGTPESYGELNGKEWEWTLKSKKPGVVIAVDVYVVANYGRGKSYAASSFKLGEVDSTTGLPIYESTQTHVCPDGFILRVLAAGGGTSWPYDLDFQANEATLNPPVIGSPYPKGKPIKLDPGRTLTLS